MARGEPSPGADVSTGGPSPGADVGGVGPVRPGADVESGGPSLGAERGRGEPSPGAEMPGLGSPARWTDARTFLLPLTEASISRLTEQAIAVWHSAIHGGVRRCRGRKVRRPLFFVPTRLIVVAGHVDHCRGVDDSVDFRLHPAWAN